jgi:hypothetical protein
MRERDSVACKLCGTEKRNMRERDGVECKLE